MPSFPDARAAIESGVPVGRIMSLYRAVVWTRLLHARHLEIHERDSDWMRIAFESGEGGSFEQGAEGELYQALWHSMLYAVVEIWRSYNISSPEIDPLVADERIKLLKDFRNATFHPRDYADKRIDDLIYHSDDPYQHFTATLAAFERFLVPIAEADHARRKAYPGAPGA